MTFEKFTDERWEAIRSIRKNWPNGIDWRREIERIGRDHWEAQAAREMWVRKLRGRRPVKERGKVDNALKSIRQLQKELAVMVADALLDDDFPHPDLKSPERRLEEWLSDYDLWVRPFAGQSDPIQAELEWRLMDLWTRSGRKLVWSRKKDDPTTPYGELIEFLTLTLDAILGKSLGPFGVAKMIDRHRGQRNRHDPWLMYAMRARTMG